MPNINLKNLNPPHLPGSDPGLSAWLHFRERRTDGSFDSLQTVQVPVREVPAPRSGQTVTGYGEAIPMRYMVQWNGKWRRVKCRIFSNNGTLHLGDIVRCTVTIERDNY